MGLPQETSTHPTENPSTSETMDQGTADVDARANSSVVGATDPTQLAGGAISGGSHGSAEAAADKLYEERMEEEKEDQGGAKEIEYGMRREGNG
ncbi:hypothetical protein MBLNU459_g6884t1 [Dothideomycetes sp. NU459]